MKIHTFSTAGEFTDEEIKDVEDFVMKRLKPLKKRIEKSEGTIFITVKSEETSFKLVGFSPLVHILIKQELRKTKY